MALNSWLAALAIVMIALAVRSYNLDWDEGTHAHPDERHLTLVTVALQLPSGPGEYFDTADSRLNPYNLENTPSFVYGTLPVFLTKAVAELTGNNNYDDLVIVGRQISALFGAGAVLFAFLIGRRLYSPAAGLVAALLLGTAPLAIQHSHFFIVDTHLTFFMAGAMFFAVRVAQEGHRRDYALAGLMLGLGMACKVTGALFLPVLFVAAGIRLWPLLAHYRGWHERMARPVLLVVLALFVAFLAFRVAQPYAFDGVVSLNQQWVDDQREQERLLGGEVGFPPSVQWIDRTSYLYPLSEMVMWGMGPAFGIAAWAAFAYACYRTVWRGDARHLLALLFVLVYFGFMGRQFSLYMRYFLPLYPVLAVLAGYALVELWRTSRALAKRTRRDWLSPVGPVLTGIVLVGATVAGLAYTGIYSRDFTRAEATRWLYDNVPDGAVLAGESWDETLPMGIRHPPTDSRFEVFGLNLYDIDRPEKIEQLVTDLGRADYVTVSSNRLMNSLPRNTTSYPIASHYHDLLLEGALGYELVAEFTSYPQLLGIDAPDHAAQESWSSYDHPRVLIFEKSPTFSSNAVEQVLRQAGPYATRGVTPAEAEGPDLLFTQSELETQQEGGTWTDVFSDGGLAGNYPTLLWLVALQVAALAVTPLTLLLFKRLPDRGYLLAKPLGLLLLAYLTWIGVSLKLVHFAQDTVIAMLLLLALSGVLITFRAWDDITGFFRRNWRLVLFSEAIFFAAFFLFWFLRLENPDLWHPFRGGEKPMDLAYLTAVTRSTTLPPIDPWFAGGYINYYYMGQFFTATLLRLTTITPEIAYNLAIPTYFSLTAAAAFSVAYNLAGTSRRLINRGARAGTHAGATVQQRAALIRDVPGWSLYIAGLLGVFLVAVAGNLDGVGQLVERLSEVSSFHASTGLPVVDSIANSAGGLWQVAVQGAPLRDFDFWRSSRMMPPTIAITEFPFFSFLFADLHAHMMAIAFQILTIGVCLAVVLKPRGKSSAWDDYGLVVLLGLIVGSQRWINSWDYPTFLLLGAASILISERHMDGGLYSAGRRAALKCVLMGSISLIAFQPYLANYRTPVAGITSSPEQTLIHQYLAHFGVFAAIIGPGLVVWLTRLLKRIRLTNPAGTSGLPTNARQQTTIVLMATAILMTISVSTALIAIGQPLVGVLLPILAMVAVLSGFEILRPRPESGIRLFVLALVGLGLGLTMGVDVIILEGDIMRMNTVFKFYLHAWVLFALASSFIAWHLLFVEGRALLSRVPTPSISWHQGLVARTGLAGLMLLLLGALIYPLLATPVRLDDRFADSNSFGLDGAAFADTTTYGDENGPIELAKDMEGIYWMRHNVRGTPTIVEGRAALYRWGGRFSIYTGLPTVIGWDWHQTQQRGDLAYMVQERVADVDGFYNTVDVAAALAFLDRYEVRYVVVGQLESHYYDKEGIAKFESGLNGAIQPVFRNDVLTVYQVDPEALAGAQGQGAFLDQR